MFWYDYARIPRYTSQNASPKVILHAFWLVTVKALNSYEKLCIKKGENRMGLIKAAMGAAGGVMADQWKEFFYCDSMDKDVMVKKGQKRVSGRSSNTKGSDNIITNGSGIAVADGQCMIIVEQGKIVEVCAEPGQFTFDSSTEPSIFTGSLGKMPEGIFHEVTPDQDCPIGGPASFSTTDFYRYSIDTSAWWFSRPGRCGDPAWRKYRKSTGTVDPSG